MALANKIPFSTDYLKSRLDYNPETGIFKWNYCSEMPNSWNTKFANKIAGTSKSKTGYVSINLNYKIMKAHRIAYLFVFGVEPLVIDHINGVRNDNRISNLRNSTVIKNACNQKLRSDNKSGQFGVGFDKVLKKWRCRITVNKQRLHLGFYSDYNEAVKVRKEAELQYRYSPLHGRER